MPDFYVKQITMTKLKFQIFYLLLFDRRKLLDSGIIQGVTFKYTFDCVNKIWRLFSIQAPHRHYKREIHSALYFLVAPPPSISQPFDLLLFDQDYSLTAGDPIFGQKPNDCILNLITVKIGNPVLFNLSLMNILYTKVSLYLPVLK